MIREAKKRYPNIDLQVRDIEQNKFRNKSFDYVVSSQIFNYKQKSKNNTSHSRKMMRIMYKLSKKGVAVDFLSSYVDYKESHLFYHSPESQISFAKKISNRVTLRHDYPLFEFCIYIYPNFKGWKSK